MTRLSIGDASLTNILARQGALLRQQVQQASQEVATGRHADLGQVVRGDLSPVLAIDATLARLEAYGSNTTDAGLYAEAQQTAMGALSKLAGGITTTLLGARDFPTAAQVDAIAADARGRLASAIGLLNTQAAGQAVFSGTQSDRVPLGGPDALLTALATAAATATTADQVETAVNTWFADPLGYPAFYQGGDPRADVPIAPGEAAEIATTALDPTIRRTIAGLAMAALIDRGILGGDVEERAHLAQTAGQTLMTSEDARITLAARIGTVQAQIETARTRNSAEESALGILRSDIGTADPYEAATRLETLRAQLESLYLVTARVSRLSLVEYLR